MNNVYLWITLEAIFNLMSVRSCVFSTDSYVCSGSWLCDSVCGIIHISTFSIFDKHFQALANLLYQAAKEFGYVDPRRVRQILEGKTTADDNTKLLDGMFYQLLLHRKIVLLKNNGLTIK